MRIRPCKNAEMAKKPRKCQFRYYLENDDFLKMTVPKLVIFEVLLYSKIFAKKIFQIPITYSKMEKNLQNMRNGAFKNVSF